MQQTNKQTKNIELFEWEAIDDRGETCRIRNWDTFNATFTYWFFVLIRYKSPKHVNVIYLIGELTTQSLDKKCYYETIY